MAEDVQPILNRIKKTKEKASLNEVAAILLILELGRHFLELREKARGKWLKELDKLGFKERIARRHLKIAEEWTPDRTPGSDLLAKLSLDLQKLEWLCRLPLEQLRAVCLVLDCRNSSRGQVIATVKRVLDLEEPADNKQLTRTTILKKWGSSRERLLSDLQELDEADRQEVIQELEETLVQLRMSLHEVRDELGSDEGEEAEETSDDGADDGAEEQEAGKSSTDAEADPEEEEPARKAKPTSANGRTAAAAQPVGRSRAKRSTDTKENEEEEPDMKPEPPKPTTDKAAGGRKQRAKAGV